MRTHLKTIAKSSLLLAAVNQANTQYGPPPPAGSFPGFVNAALRKNDPEMNKWDFAGSDRLRYEIKKGFAIPGKPGSVDFRAQGADTDNEYLLNRLRVHAAYSG